MFTVSASVVSVAGPIPSNTHAIPTCMYKTNHMLIMMDDDDHARVMMTIIITTTTPAAQHDVGW